MLLHTASVADAGGTGICWVQISRRSHSAAYVLFSPHLCVGESSPREQSRMYAWLMWWWWWQGIKVLTGAGCGNYLLPVQTFVLLFVVCRADEVAHGSRG